MSEGPVGDLDGTGDTQRAAQEEGEREKTARTHPLPFPVSLGAQFRNSLWMTFNTLFPIHTASPYTKKTLASLPQASRSGLASRFFDIEEARLPGSVGEGSEISIAGSGKKGRQHKQDAPVKVVIENGRVAWC